MWILDDWVSNCRVMKYKAFYSARFFSGDRRPYIPWKQSRLSPLIWLQKSRKLSTTLTVSSPLRFADKAGRRHCPQSYSPRNKYPFIQLGRNSCRDRTDKLLLHYSQEDDFSRVWLRTLRNAHRCLELWVKNILGTHTISSSNPSSLINEYVRSNGTGSALYSGGDWFESRPRHYLDLGFTWFSHYLQAYATSVPSIIPLPFPFTSFLIHFACHLIIQPHISWATASVVK
jgi:hypothetical protein